MFLVVYGVILCVFKRVFGVCFGVFLVCVYLFVVSCVFGESLVCF